MLKDKILRTLNDNKELIKTTFNIDDNGIDNIIKFLHKDYDSFKVMIDNIFLSDMGDREKMVLHYIIGYTNGRRVKNFRDDH